MTGRIFQSAGAATLAAAIVANRQVIAPDAAATIYREVLKALVEQDVNILA